MCKWPAGGAERMPSDVGRRAQGPTEGRVQTHGGELCVVRADSTFIHSFNVCILHFTAGEKTNLPAEWHHHVLNLKNIR